MRALAFTLVPLLVAACSSPDVTQLNHDDLDYAVRTLEDPTHTDEVVDRLNAILVDTQPDPRDNALQRFYASFLLARLHMNASETTPFLTEASSSRNRIGSIGRRDDAEDAGLRPSRTGHVIAAMYHASRARGLFDRALRSGPAREGVALVPDSLWTYGVARADTSLQILITLGYFRLGFREEVAEVLARSPDLLDLESCLTFLDLHDIPATSRPWVCAMLFEYLRAEDELEAYRFGVVAVESAERFGHALPASRIEAIETWIVDGASVLFVDPESQTPYLPGATRSPISGVPHIDYVAVER